jgi:fatty acid desaturase
VSSVILDEPKTKSLSDPEFKWKLQSLRQTNNWTNWYYLIRTYIYLTIVISATIWYYSLQQTEGFSFFWNVPVTFLAILLIGAGQHQLSGLAHEGVHHILFKARYLNELASDLLTMFPLFSSTHHYRLQHLAHHQFVNDPDRDPDISQLKTSGHWLNFPVERKTFIRILLKQLWLPNLIRFMRIRAAYNATGTDKNPYLRKGQKPSKVAVRIGIFYLLALIGTLISLFYAETDLLLAIVPPAMWLGICLVYWKLPDNKFHQSRVHPVIPLRYMTMMRLGYITLLFTSFAWGTRLTGHWVTLYFFLLWIVPLFTSFAFFMILRQWVQHGNGDRGWLTNTRTFLINRFIHFSVFPMGQDYHLPHHMYASIPHYRLKQLHEVLIQYPEYRDEAIVVEGYFYPPHLPQKYPTVIDILGPEYSQKHCHSIHIDNSVMDDGDFEDKEQLKQEGELLKRSESQTG